MKPVLKQTIGAGVAACALLSATQATAEGDWEGMIGIGAFSEPEFLGSSENDTNAFPMFELTWRDRIFIGGQGIGAYVFKTENFAMSAAIGYDEGRDAADSVFLTGLGNIDGGATFNLGFEYEVGPVTPYLEVSKLSKGSKGVTATVGAEAMVPLRALTGRGSFDFGEDVSPRDMGPMLTMGISADWGNDDYNHTYYGVTAAQSATSGLGQYTATSGFHAVNFEIGVQVPLSERWSVGGMVTYSQLMGDAKDSTIVRDTSGTSVGVFAAYRF